MAVLTRIKNNQVTDASAGNVYLGVNAAAKVQDYSITAGKIQNNLTYGSDLTITGNLTVQGNTTTIDTVNLVVEDPLILLAKEQTGSPTLDIGFIGKRGTSDNIAWVWDESANSFVSVFTTSEVTNTTISINSYAAITTANISATTGNFSGNVQVANLSVVGNISGAANFSGNVTASNFLTTGIVSATGNVTGGNVNTGGAVSATGNVDSGNVNTAIVSASGNVTGANLVTGGLVTATGNITGGNVLTGGLVSATGNVNSGANIVATANVVGGNLTTAGVVTATGNVTGGNLLTGGLISATGNVTSGNVNTGIVSASGNVAAAGFTGGNVSVTGNVIAQYFIGNISGNIDAAGSNTQVQFNDDDLLGGSANFTFDKATNILAVTGTVQGTTVSATGNVIGGNVSTAGLVTATGNVTGGNVNTGGVVSATGNVNSGNVNTGIVSASGNVNSGNVNTAIMSASGNVTGANLVTGGLITATGNINGAAVNTAQVASTGGITISSGGSSDLVLSSGGNINADSNYINNLLDPVQNQDAATKVYVDNLVATGLTYHEQVFVSTTANLATTTGGTITYAQPNGAGNGIGATITTTGSFNLIDTGNVQTVGTRILVKDEGNAVLNGVYTWSNATVITRSTDADEYGIDSAQALSLNSYFFTAGGNVNKGSAYVVAEPSGTITFGSSNIVFDLFSTSQVYSANTQAGISLTGTVFAAKVDNNTTAFDGGGNISVKAGANLTTPNIGAATGTSLNVTGNVDGGNLNTGGAVSATGNVNSGNVNTTLVSATGNVVGANVVTGGLVTATGNITGGNVLTGGLISATGNVDSGNVNTAIVSASGNVTGANVVTGGLVTATGNVTGGNLNTGGAVSATGNVNSGNVNTGIVSASGNITGGNLLTSGSGGAISGSGNITGGNLLTGGLISATGNVNSGNVNTGIVSASGNVAAAGFTGGNVSVTGNVIAQNFIGNISGNIDAAGANTQVQFNDNDLLGASANFTFNTATNVLSVTGTVQGTTVSATGNVIGGNVSTAGLITATGNITGANLILTSGTIDGPAAGRITVNASDIDTDFAIDGDSTPNVFYVDAGLGTTSFGNSGAIANAIVSFNTTNSVKMPVGTQLQRPDPATIGMLRFSTSVDALEVYSTAGWETVGVPAFTVITDDQFAGTGACTTFTLSEDSTTAATIVSINGVVQIPTTAYSVTGNSLVFTEAPEVSDVIDARLLTTTTTVTSIENTSGNAVIETLETAATVQITGNLLPAANVTYDIGSNAFRWNDAYFNGTTITLGNIQIKNSTGTTIGFFGPDGTTPATIDSTNIDTTSIANGNSNMTVIASGGNIRANVGGATILQITSAGIINGQGNGVGNIGNSTGYFNTIFAKATSAQYADLAEMYVADQMIEPGTVVCFGGDHEITICDTDSCSRVAGVISTNPSYIMNAGLAGDHVVAVALTGRVPTRVTGQVRKGDMMVSTVDGRARACATPAVGQVIGKALADFDGTDGVIEVVVGRL